MSDETRTPMHVIKGWADQCQCCTQCHQQSPCGGVMAGGLCDNLCDCDEDFDYCDEDFE